MSEEHGTIIHPVTGHAVPTTFRDFEDFYQHVYLEEHSSRANRIVHFAGNCGVLASIAYAVATRRWYWLLAAPLFMTGPAYLGHQFFEGMHQTGARTALYSMGGSWRMFWEICSGKQQL